MFFLEKVLVIFFCNFSLNFFYRTANKSTILESTYNYESIGKIIIAKNCRTSEILRLKPNEVYSEPCTQFNLHHNSEFYYLLKLEKPTIKLQQLHS
jgi:hypothetical protein